jgi:hypothetical protein
MQYFKHTFLLLTGVLFIVNSHLSFSQTGSFDYKRSLFGTPSTLSLNVQSINKATGSVAVNGGDTQSPTIPFIWNWGDGTTLTGFFPQGHTYSDVSKNYIVNVTATYADGNKDSNQVLIRFIAPVINPISLPSTLAVTIPTTMPIMGSRLGPLPSQLSVFNNSFFTTIPRSTLEYVLSVCAKVENDFVNNNVYQFNGSFNQVLLRDSTFAGAYSIWFSNPVAFGVSDGFLQGTIGYSSFFHEMGHNFTLNTPSTYYYGGKVDGYANAIYSESMAQIFQHSAGYEIINNYQAYGLSDDLVFDIKQSVLSSISVIRASYEQYLASGKNFASWNDPSTPVDETLNTFMTIAYKFCEHAENLGLGYKAPLKRMLNLLQGFNPNWAQLYNPLNNSAAADTFRATLMVTALSYAFSTDLRAEFRNLNFPVSDQTYNELYASVTSIIPPDSVRKVSPLNRSFDNIQPIQLKWLPPLGASSYLLQFGTDSTFATTIVDTLGLTDTIFTVSGLSNLTTYYWRVNAMNAGGTSPWSQTWSFNSSITGISNIKSDLPVVYELYQNYPNPFNPSTVINYSIPKTSLVTIKVYDILGKEVATLVNEEKSAGNYSVQFNGGNLSSGIYFYRMHAGSFTETKKLILLK